MDVTALCFKSAYKIQPRYGFPYEMQFVSSWLDVVSQGKLDSNFTLMANNLFKCQLNYAITKLFKPL